MPETVVTAPDGEEIVVEHPEGATDEQILAYARQQYKPKSQPAPKRGPVSTMLRSLGDAAGGVAEAGLTFGLGAVSEPVAGIAGIAAGLTPGGKTAAEMVDQVQNARLFNYQPRTETGRGIVDAAAKVAEPIERFADTAGEVTGDPEDTLGATAVKTGILSVPSLLGLRGVRRSARTNRQNLAMEAQELGYVIDPDSAGVETVTGGIGGKLKTQQMASARNQQVTDRLVKEHIGLPEDVDLSPESLGSLRRNLSADYEAVKSAGQIGTDTTYRRAVASVRNEFSGAQRDFPDLKMSAVDEVRSTADSLLVDNFDSGSAVQAIRFLRSKADQAYNAKNGIEGSAYKRLADALEETVERDLSRQLGPDNDIVARFRNARRRTAETYTIQNALDGSSVSAPKLAAAANKGAPFTGNMAAVAKFAQNFPKLARVMKEAIPQFSPLDLAAAPMTASLPAIAAVGGAGTGPLAASAIPALMQAGRPLLREMQLGPIGQRAVGRQGVRSPGLLRWLLVQDALNRDEQENTQELPR